MSTETTTFTSELMDGAETVLESDLKKFLIFESDKLLLGADVDYVVEIITSHIITPLPIVPNFIRGIINLRGQIIPVLDIRLRLGKEPANDDCIIVLDIEGAFIGILVDSVAQMVTVNKNDVLPVPERNSRELVSGMYTLQDGSTMLILDCFLLMEH